MDKLFETNRVRVRRLVWEDLEGFYDMQSNSNVMQYIKASQDLEESSIELKKFIQYYSTKEKYFCLWAVELKDDHTFLGIFRGV